MKIWRTPSDFSRTPGGTRTPGWEPLLYAIGQLNILRQKGSNQNTAYQFSYSASLSSNFLILFSKFINKV